MHAHLRRVAAHGVITCRVVRRLDRIEVGLHRGFRIDDDRLAAGQVDDEVGSEFFPFVGGCCVLGFEITVFLHAGEFDHAAELDFAPLPAAGGLA